MTAGPRVDWRQRRRWAFEALEIEARGATGIRSALFDRLGAAGYAPDAAGLEAADFLIRPATVSEHAAAEFERRREARLLRGISRLAQHWFQLNPHERRDRWNRLSAAAIGYPLARAWLQHLERGLELPQRLPEAAPGTAFLLQTLCRVFAAPPAQRGRLRHACRRHLNQFDADAVRTAVVDVQKHYSQWARLDPRLLKSVARRPSDPLPAPPRSWWQDYAPFAWGGVVATVMMLRLISGPSHRVEDHIPKFQPPPRMTMPVMRMETMITPEIRALLARESTLTSEDCLRLVQSFHKPSHLQNPEIASAATYATLTLQGAPDSERDAVDRIYRRVIREGLLAPKPPRLAEPFSGDSETDPKSEAGSVPALRIEAPDDEPLPTETEPEPARIELRGVTIP